MKKQIIIALDKSRLRDELIFEFSRLGLGVKTAVSESQILKQIKSDHECVLLTQMELRGADAIELLLELKDMHLELPVVALVQDDRQNKLFSSLLHENALVKLPCQTSEIVQVVSHAANYIHR